MSNEQPTAEKEVRRCRWLRANCSSDKIDIAFPDENEDGTTDTYYTASADDLDRLVDGAMGAEKPAHETSDRRCPYYSDGKHVLDSTGQCMACDAKPVTETRDGQ